MKAPNTVDVFLARGVVGCLYAGGLIAILGFHPEVGLPLWVVAAFARAADGWATHKATSRRYDARHVPPSPVDSSPDRTRPDWMRHPTEAGSQAAV